MMATHYHNLQMMVLLLRLNKPLLPLTPVVLFIFTYTNCAVPRRAAPDGQRSQRMFASRFSLRTGVGSALPEFGA